MEKNNIRITDDNENNFFENVDSDLLIEKTMPYMELMMKYGCALKEITTKFEVLNSEFSLLYNRNPIESIKTRLKRPRSIVAKLAKHGIPVTVQNIPQMNSAQEVPTMSPSLPDSRLPKGGMPTMASV